MDGALSNRGFQKFMGNIENFAPNREEALSITTADGRTFKVWKNANQAYCIQLLANWNQGTAQNMLSFRRNAEHELCYFLNEVPTAVLSPEQHTLIVDVAEKIAVKKLMDDQKHVFNPNCLRLMLSYLESQNKIEDCRTRPSSASFNSHLAIPGVGGSSTAIETVASARALEAREIANRARGTEDYENLAAVALIEEDAAIRAAGTRIAIWGSKERIANPSGGATPFTEIYKIHIQDSCYYEGGPLEHTTKLSLTINKSTGEITEILIANAPPTGERTLSQIIYHPESEWNIKLTAIMNKFLDMQAIKMRPHDILLHRLSLELRPEIVLRDLCGLGLDTPFRMPTHNVKFMTDRLVEGPGTDAGGPSQDLVGTLAKNLFAGTASRTLEMKEGLPSFSKPFDDENRQVLANIGKFLSAGYSSHEYSLGRVVGDNFFALLRAALNTPNLHSLEEPSDAQIFAAVLPLAIATFNSEREAERSAARAAGAPLPSPGPYDQAWIYPYVQNPHPQPLTQNQIALLVDVLDWAERSDEGTLSPQDAQQAIKNAIILDWKDRYRAAWGCAKGIPADSRTNFTTGAIETISTSIQGERFNRDTIADSFYSYNTSSAVGNQKLAWLKEHIRDPNTPKEWIEGLLLAISGRTSVVLGQNLGLNPTGLDSCHVHTCSKYVDIPNRHIDFDAPNRTASFTDSEAVLKARFITEIGTIIGSVHYTSA